MGVLVFNRSQIDLREDTTFKVRDSLSRWKELIRK